MKRHKGENMKITIETGDITTYKTDVIVNAANSNLERGGGVCGAIFDAVRAAGGHEAYGKLTDACFDIRYCATGDAVITPSFGLPAPFIIHAVGPVWTGREKPTGSLTKTEIGHVEALASAYRAIIRLCEKNNLRSVTIPAISTGIFNFPVDLAAAIATEVCRVELTEANVEVTLVGFNEKATTILRGAPTPEAAHLLSQVGY
jgi:O-acetyl-ADP-ribose deacetylase (regulator of RNase III)